MTTICQMIVYEWYLSTDDMVLRNQSLLDWHSMIDTSLLREPDYDLIAAGMSIKGTDAYADLCAKTAV